MSTVIAQPGFHHQTQLSFAFLSIWIKILLGNYNLHFPKNLCSRYMVKRVKRLLKEIQNYKERKKQFDIISLEQKSKGKNILGPYESSAPF